MVDRETLSPDALNDRPPPPIWAPHPGVPAMARVLQYLFAGLILACILLSIWMQRPIDTPRTPTTWQLVHSDEGPYLYLPAEWGVHARPYHRGSALDVPLAPGSPVRIWATIQILSRPTDPVVLAQEADKFEAVLKTQCVGYFPLRTGAVDPSVGGIRRFSFHANDRKNRPFPMEGAWAIRGYGNRVVCVMAQSPQPGWGTMEGIFTHVLHGIKFEPTPAD